MLFRKTIKQFLLKLIGIYPYKVTTCSSLEMVKNAGLKVGENFSMQQGCIIDDSHCWMISIGDNVTLAPNVHILAHDASTKKTLGYTRIAPVRIGNNVFIGAGSIILPGVNVGDNVIIGAGSCISKDVPSDSVVVSNGKIIKSYDQYIREQSSLIEIANKESRVYGESYTVLGGVTEDKKREMMEKNGGYIV